jgi:hypothetical protein
MKLYVQNHLGRPGRTNVISIVIFSKLVPCSRLNYLKYYSRTVITVWLTKHRPCRWVENEFTTAVLALGRWVGLDWETTKWHLQGIACNNYESDDRDDRDVVWSINGPLGLVARMRWEFEESTLVARGKVWAWVKTLSQWACAYSYIIGIPGQPPNTN